MPHVELSLTGGARRLAPLNAGQPTASLGIGSSLECWAAVAAGATEPCLVLRPDGVIVATSGSGAELLGLGDPATALGRPLREAVGNLVDFTASLAQLDNSEADKIPPLLALSSGRLARGLMRIVCPISGIARTLDAIATPLWDGPTLAGSLAFFSEI